MAVYIVCPKCKAEYSVKKKGCPKCGYVAKQNKTFRVSVSFHGTRVRQTITGSNLQGAREIEAKIKSELVSGEYYDRRQVKVVFEEFVRKKYLPNSKENKKVKTYRLEKSLLRLWILPIIGNKALKNITPFDLERIKKTMKDAGKSPRTINYALAVIRQVFNKAIMWDIFKGVNPVNKVKLAKLNNKRLRFLTSKKLKHCLKK